MKKFFILIFLFLSFQSYGQKGFTKYASKFYSIIDSTHKLDCCDSCSYGISITYEIPLLEFPYDKVDLEDYESKHTDDDFMNAYIDNLVEAYYKIKPSIRNKITKSCYTIKTNFDINRDVTNDGFYWVEGTLTIKFIFQTDDKNFSKPWWKKLFKK